MDSRFRVNDRMGSDFLESLYKQKLGGNSSWAGYLKHGNAQRAQHREPQKDTENTEI